MFKSAFLTELDALLARHSVARTMRGNTIILTDLGSAEAEGKTMLRMYGRHYGLNEHDYGTVFNFRGTRYKLIGLKTSRPKYPLVCEHMGDGRTFKFDVGVVPTIVALRQPQAPAAPALPQAPTPTIIDQRYAGAARF